MSNFTNATLSTGTDAEPLERNGVGGRIRTVIGSIRTRYALMTAFFLLLAMAMFYVGGRIVLVHFISDTERQVRAAGIEIRIAPDGCYQGRPVSRSGKAAADGFRYGIEPLFSEAMDFYSGGFWKLRNDPLKTVVAIRDVADNAVTPVTVTMPKTFGRLSRIAIWRLAFFVAIGGILLVLPVFWAQNRLLLDPLTKMTRAIRDLKADGVDCPRIEWKRRDEFAQLAESVNRMIETIAAKTVSLANSEASHQALIDGVPDALVVFDGQGRLVSVTKQPEGVPPVPGFFPGDVPASSVFGIDAIADFLKAVRTTAEKGVTSNVRLKVQRPLGVPKSVPTRHFELRLTRLTTRFVLAIVRDVTAEVAEHKLRLAAEQRALDVSKRESLTGLAAGIAHDMNNILSVVLAAAEAEGADPSGDSVRTLATIREAVSRGSSMMRELMTFAGENRIRLMRAKAQMVMDDTRHLVGVMVGKNIVLTVGDADGVPDVDIDPNQFWKVFFNIIKNAGEAIGPARPGKIEMSAGRFRMTESVAARFVSEHPLAEGDGVLFRVEDDGPGIPDELLQRIFDPYVSSKALGRGLGLATVRTIVEAHGGGIRVRNSSEGGAVFSIFLPASHLPEASAGEHSDAPRKKDGDDVLVVDNDEAILKTISILLKARKLTPHVARNRRESLAIVRRRADTLRAIILDAHIGGLDTVRLLNAFRIAAPGVKVIVSSGSAAPDIEKMFRAHPYDAFLAKPYTIAELSEKLGLPRTPSA